MKTKSADGVSISYQHKGSGSPALVFVHGWCCDKSYWNSQIPYFAKKNEVVTLDLAGHGDSGIDRDNWTMTAFGEDVAAIIDQLSLEQVVLIGHSMGGPVVIAAAQLIPERIRGIVGVDAFQDLHFRILRESLDEMLTGFQVDFKKASRNYVTSMFPETSDPELVESIISDMGSAPPRMAMEALQEVVAYDLIGEIEKIQVPIRCICSNWRPFYLETAGKYISSFKVKFMSGVGHFVMLEDPRTFNSLLDEMICDITIINSKTLEM